MKRKIYLIIIIFIFPFSIMAQNTFLNQNKIQSSVLLSDVNLSQNKYLNNYLFSNKTDTSLLDRSGNIKFLVGNIINSIGAYAWMVPVQFKMTNVKSIVVTYTFIGAGGIIIPSLLTKNHNITTAQGKFKNYGQFKGFLDGFLLNSITKHDRPFGLPIILSVTEATAGYLLPGALKMTKEQVIATSTYGLIGYGLGFFSQRTFFSGDTTKLWAPFMVGGSLIGEIGGYFLSKNDKFTSGDSYALVGTTYLGTGIASTVLILTENYDIINPTITLGLAAGIAVGSYLGYKYDVSGIQGMLSNIFGLSSGLVAIGMTALVLPADKYELQIFAPVASLFSTVGFGLSYRYFVRNNATQKTSFNKKINYSFDLNPAAAFSAYKSGTSIFKFENQYIPVGQFQLKF